MLNGYTGTLVLALHLLPVVLLWATWKLPQAAAGSKIVLGQTLGSGVFLLLFPMAEQLHWGWGSRPSAWIWACWAGRAV